MTEVDPAPDGARRQRHRARRERADQAVPTAPEGPTSDSNKVAGDEPPTFENGSADRAKESDHGRPPGRDTDRGWRDLAGNTPSQVGVGGAMRARDVARPTAADLDEAERDTEIVRRQWRPPAADPGIGGRPESSRS
ncbi:MAG TPA: hypothetical protein VGH11_19235 [Jatrophihabitans sp.]